jgi:hypothetical protein
MTATDTRRPEITVLTDEQKSRALEEVRRRAGTCSACGGEQFIVGDALYLGFLFVSENLDAYMVALTCANPECPAPRRGIRLPASQFL